MKKDNFKTVVIFRKFKAGDILALFPYENESNYFVGSYQHVGQHSAADYNAMVQNSVPAKKSEYNDLKRELEGIGYNLEIRLRAQRSKMYKS